MLRAACAKPVWSAKFLHVLALGMQHVHFPSHFSLSGKGRCLVVALMELSLCGHVHENVQNERQPLEHVPGTARDPPHSRGQLASSWGKAWPPGALNVSWKIGLGM